MPRMQPAPTRRRGPGPAERETRSAFVPSKPTPVGLEPRLSALSEGRSPYPASGVPC